jgi:hypothetical protein
MLERCTELSHRKLDLQPFDQAILAAILVRADELRTQGVEQMDFCELDSHLQPWDKDSRPKKPLTEIILRAFSNEEAWLCRIRSMVSRNSFT